MRIYLRLLVVSLLLFAGNIVYAEAQQEKRVTGTVTSEGEPLPGVSVQLKGASSGTITDIDGNYSIEVPATGTLVFRFVGMRSVEQPVNNRSVINVTLESESKELEEVMVVAYATAKKYSFTGAASTMKAGEIEKLQTSSVSRVLEGTVSGVQASAASGQPGTDAEIERRGQLHTAYDAALEGLGLMRPIVREGQKWNNAYYPILMPDERCRDLVERALLAEHIHPRRYFYPSLNILPYLNQKWRTPCPVAENAARRALCLPMSGHLSEDHVRRATRSVRNVLRYKVQVQEKA